MHAREREESGCHYEQYVIDNLLDQQFKIAGTATGACPNSATEGSCRTRTHWWRSTPKKAPDLTSSKTHRRHKNWTNSEHNDEDFFTILQLYPWWSGVCDERGAGGGAVFCGFRTFISQRLQPFKTINIATSTRMYLETFWWRVTVLQTWCFHGNRILQSCLYNVVLLIKM